MPQVQKPILEYRTEKKKNMKEILLTKGYVALVDDDDFEFLNQWKWHVMIRGKYPLTSRRRLE
jgi:hypothetical protein